MGLDIRIKKVLRGFLLNMELSCEQGITGILGQSGSGKSMLLNCIAGLIQPDEGYIRINGRTLFDAEQKINLPPKDRRVGFLFQNYALFPHMTVLENVAFGMSGMKKKEKLEKAASLLARFHLFDMRARYPAQISGGQQQRVALARAMLVEPEMFLLDEPFSALDHHLKTQMMKDTAQTLRAYGGNTLFVTHNIDEAYQLCDQIAVISDGTVEVHGAKKDIFQHPRTPQSTLLTGCRNIGAATCKASHMLEVHEWGIQLQTNDEITEEQGFAGFRATDIRLAEANEAKNCHVAWIADEIDSPFSSTLYLKFGTAPDGPDDYHIQWAIDKQQRALMGDVSQPIHIYLNPEHIFFLTERTAHCV
ncbi:MAG: sulfate/molybdate ABC transporter ATP-binding protein [Oscillospiraceae bacterium]|nr:sulfate/molybdate ABC transporter ATP-binding protein [Oscillospiraceae bacterium]